ncbi:MAG: AraC family transcriptional regulator [Candidatus Ventricola sp.]
MVHTIAHYVDSLLTQDQARQVLPNAGMVVGWYTNKKNVASVVHSHPYYELILPIAGEVLYSCSGSLYHINKGDLILFPDEVYHMGRYDIGKKTSERLLLQVDGSMFDQFAASLGFEHCFKDKRPVVYNADFVSAWGIRDLFMRIGKFSQMPPQQRDILFRGQLTELLIILCACSSEGSIGEADASSALVSKAQKFIQQHYTDPAFSINQLTDYLYVSRSHISRVFREYTMESIHGYLTDLRLQHFKIALGEGKSILAACTESGFSDYSSFLKTFRKTYNITPNEYRKRLFQNPEQMPVENVVMLDMNDLSMMAPEK